MTEKLGVLLVDVPKPKYSKYTYVARQSIFFNIRCSDNIGRVIELAYKCTKEEAKKHPQFRWVALEEL